MIASLSSLCKKSFTLQRSLFAPVVSYNFFFSKSKTPTLDQYNFDPKIKEDLLHDKKFSPSLKNIQSFPIEIGRDLHTEAKSDTINIFNKSTYLRMMAREEFTEWESIFNLYCKALEEKDPSILKGKAEIHVIKRMEQFFRDISGLGLQLEIFKPEKTQNILTISTHRILEGVFIDRILNLHSTDYFVQKSGEKQSFEPSKGKKWSEKATSKLPKVDPKELVDQDIEINYLEIDRSKMSINQYVMEVETNLRFALTRKDNSKIVYGGDEAGWETHYLLIENRRDVFKKYPYYLTDFDFVLNKNPHIYGSR